MAVCASTLSGVLRAEWQMATRFVVVRFAAVRVQLQPVVAARMRLSTVNFRSQLNPGVSLIGCARQHCEGRSV